MYFDSFSHLTLTESFIAHVLWGDPKDPSKGGHFFGVGRESKTEFPESWSIDMIVCALSHVLRTPQVVIYVGPRIILRRVVDDVCVQVVLRSTCDQLVLFAAYPIGGPGVIQNVMGKQHKLPHHYLRKGL